MNAIFILYIDDEFVSIFFVDFCNKFYQNFNG